MVRTETSQVSASAGAVAHPRACRVVRIESSRLARMAASTIPDTGCQVLACRLLAARQAQRRIADDLRRPDHAVLFASVPRHGHTGAAGGAWGALRPPC